MTDSNCPILPGSYLLREREVPYEIPQVFRDFRTVQLESLINLEAEVYGWCVREFYHAFHFDRELAEGIRSNKCISFVLKRNVFEVTLEQFNFLMDFVTNSRSIRFYTKSVDFSRNILARADVNRDELFATILIPECINVCKNTKRVVVGHLRDDVRVHYMAIRENLTSRPMDIRMHGQPDTSRVMVIEALVLYWIKLGISVDVGFIMANIIQDIREDHVMHPLLYGMRLTHLFRTLGVLDGVTDGPSYSVPRLPLI